MNRKTLILTGIYALLNCYGFANATTMPTFSIELPKGTSSNVTVTQNSTATITYSVRNNTNTARTLTMRPITAVSQTAVAGSCNFPSMLGPKMSCNLALSINGSQVPASGISGGPVICKTIGPGNNLPDPNLCSRPESGANLNITTSSVSLLSQAISSANVLINNMIFPLKANMPQGAAAWKVKPVVGFIWGLLTQGFNIPADANLLSTSCGTPNNGATYCALVGNMLGAPILLQSADGGITWATVNIANMPAQGGLNSVSCGTDSSGISTCAAIGVDGSNIPFVLQTTNSGQTWTKVTSLSFALSTLNNVDCTVNSVNSLCQITGVENSLPVIYFFSPGAGWQNHVFPSILSANSRTDSISCASLADSSINCLVSIKGDSFGNNLIKTEYAVNYIASIVNSSATQGTNILINAVGCTLNAGTIFCTAAGSSSNSPFLLKNSNLSVDSNWSVATINNPASGAGELVATCCTSLNNTAYCGAAGSSANSANLSPLLVSTNNNGTNWSVPPVDSAPTSGRYTTTSCSVSGGVPVITVTGTNTATNVPVIVELTNQWDVWSISNTLSTIYTF